MKDKLQWKLRENQISRELPTVLTDLGQRLGIEFTQDQILSFELTEALIEMINQVFTAEDNITCCSWPAIERQSVVDSLARIKTNTISRDLAVVYKFSSHYGAAVTPSKIVFPGIMNLCERDKRDAIVLTPDGAHGMILEHNSRNFETGEPFDHYLLSAWGEYGNSLTGIR